MMLLWIGDWLCCHGWSRSVQKLNIASSWIIAAFKVSEFNLFQQQSPGSGQFGFPLITRCGIREQATTCCREELATSLFLSSDSRQCSFPGSFLSVSFTVLFLFSFSSCRSFACFFLRWRYFLRMVLYWDSCKIEKDTFNERGTVSSEAEGLMCVLCVLAFCWLLYLQQRRPIVC